MNVKAGLPLSAGVCFNSAPSDPRALPGPRPALRPKEATDFGEAWPLFSSFPQQPAQAPGRALSRLASSAGGRAPWRHPREV